MLLEAYGVGTPVLGSDLGGIPELIDPEVTGYLATAGNVTSFAQQLTAMAELSNADLEEMGRAGRAFVEERFSREHYLTGLLDVYEELGIRTEVDR